MQNAYWPTLPSRHEGTANERRICATYRCFTHRTKLPRVLPPSLVDGHGVSPTFACGWTRCFTHRWHGVSPTELPCQANNGAGFKNRNARARSLTYKVFNARRRSPLWITPPEETAAIGGTLSSAPAARGGHAAARLVVPRRRGLPSPCPALLSPTGLRCSPPRPPGA